MIESRPVNLTLEQQRREGMKTVSRPAMVVTAFLASLALVVGVAGPALAAPPVPLVNLDCTKLASATNPAAAFDTPVQQR